MVVIRFVWFLIKNTSLILLDAMRETVLFILIFFGCMVSIALMPNWYLSILINILFIVLCVLLLLLVSLWLYFSWEEFKEDNMSKTEKISKRKN